MGIHAVKPFSLLARDVHDTMGATDGDVRSSSYEVSFDVSLFDSV